MPERTLIKNIVNDSKVHLEGFVENCRNKRTMAFIVLRDFSGVIQVTVEKEKDPALAAAVDQITIGSVIEVDGLAVKNEYVKLGGMEVLADRITLDSIADPMPLTKDAGGLQDYNKVAPAMFPGQVRRKRVTLRRGRNWLGINPDNIFEKKED